MSSTTMMPPGSMRGNQKNSEVAMCECKWEPSSITTFRGGESGRLILVSHLSLRNSKLLASPQCNRSAFNRGKYMLCFSAELTQGYLPSFMGPCSMQDISMEWSSAALFFERNFV